MSKDKQNIPAGGPERTAEVQRLIEERIFSGAIPPGGKINEKALADELEISRGPVREVLNALRFEGLVEIIPNRGAFVSSLTTKEALDCYDVRGGLAYTAGKILPFRISLEQIQLLRKMHSQMEKMIKQADVSGYYGINEEFHALLFEATGNQPLITINHGLERKLSLYLRREMSNPGMLSISNQEHIELINFIAEGRPKETAEAFENHILEGKERLLEMI